LKEEKKEKLLKNKRELESSCFKKKMKIEKIKFEIEQLNLELEIVANPLKIIERIEAKGKRKENLEIQLVKKQKRLQETESSLKAYD
jgi:hypothetical protein